MITKSYIEVINSNKLTKITSLSKELFLKIESDNKDNIFTRYKWKTSNLRVNKTKLEILKNNLLIKTKQESSPFYLIYNSDIHNFKKLDFGQGIIISSMSSLDIALHTIKNKDKNSPKTTLLVMEYDVTLQRTNTLRFSANMIHTYIPSKNTKKIVLCIEIKGQGKVLISGMTLRPEVKNDLQSDIVLMKPSLNTKNNTSTFENLKTYFDTLDEERNDCLSQVYLWKRRALAWEKKAKITPDTNILNDIGNQALLRLAQNLPKSNGCYYFQKLPYKIGIITDIYMFNYYKDTFQEVYYLSPDNYESILDTHDLDIILYVTGWKGINNEEWRGIKFREKPATALRNILKYGKEKKSKLIFQSIEDPSNFEYFLPVAEKFDYIFTSDSDMIPKYKNHLGHNNVFYGEYGFNPILNNPIASQREFIDAAFFAGSYPRRYKERCEDMEIIFDSILKSEGNLVIADRNYGAEDKEIQFPEKYKNHIIPPIEHEVLQNMHKVFRFNLNFNSIKNSPTMCAMRVYELQAQGTILISNYSKSIFNKFPNIRIIPTHENMSFDLSKEDILYEYNLRIANIRKVMDNKTSFDIASSMLDVIGLKKTLPSNKIIAVFFENADSQIEKCFTSQSYHHKVLLDLSKIQTEEEWQTIKKDKNINYFTWFNPDNEYQTHYLSDMINGFKYTNAAYITKNSYFDSNCHHDSLEHEFTDFILGKDKTIFRTDKFSPFEFKNNKLEQRVENLYNGYSIDPFELNYSKYLENLYSEKIQNPILSVIIPVYNNGEFLQYKCLPSLRKNNLWKQFEILLIDDGSTDDKTQNICSILERENKNIKTYLYPKGGSGSASRPRNKGISIASAKLITFLDPDNEISPGGYDTLLDIYKEANTQENSVSFVSGYNVKVGSTVKTIAKHTSKRISIINDFYKSYFKKGKFPTIATQAAIIEKEVFIDNPNLRFIEKAAGQDTIFGWELLLSISKGAFTSDAFLIYYADREDSVTNIVDKNYFEKKLILEKEQVKMLKKYDLFSLYNEQHFDRFMNNWYLHKLQYVKPEDHDASLKILEEICKIYNKNIQDYKKD